MRARVLLVEDDSRLAGMLVGLLTEEDYEVVRVGDGQRALHEGLTRSFDVLILDRGLPALEGLDVLTRLRSRGVRTPALILSALGNPADRIEGLDRGAEDYLAKPFDIGELLARIRALLRRHEDTSAALLVPGGTLDTVSRSVGRIALSDGEARLLEHLARRPRQVFERAELLAVAFPDATDQGMVDTYVHYLRRKLGRTVIDTVRGIGYRLGRVT
ncbi:response regulator transcription factor [Actinoplanes couchii]|uniref:Transcriptional regulator n=1 Tax=Actinoplanes couchii TaxID=403638 RepID=A0ABQ3X8H5_9ACTN|nr:response regulator transcription factor [Actinoplanes couchii]MDR6320168.1 DNA-binding response OmpR family regulator [Actinoplanes couchii]GID54818.1 transcriptional regulator [Actinoplanes couchii]